MFHEDIPTLNISKLNYWLVICIAKNNFKDDFLNIQMFLHPQIPDFQILSDHNKPYINGNIIFAKNVQKICNYPDDWFCVAGTYII